jgi:addiction module RelE/StbE family toxin
MRLEWTEPAVEDLTSIRDFIARDSPQYARQFVGRIIAAAERLKAFPEMGRRVPESLEEGIREILFNSYRIIYRREARRIRILTVLHASRDLARREPKPWEVE